MSLLHPAILTGLALTAVPVVLHLLMRARPKQLDFPALRLLQNIKRQSVQRLQLRHLLLLLLRMLLIALLVIAIARPTLPAANYGFSNREWISFVVLILLVAAGIWAGRKYWVKRSRNVHEQRWRQSLLQVGSGVGFLLLLALFVGWPYQSRVRAEIASPDGPRNLNVPVSAVLVFDVSASMGYQHENKTRTEEARQLALQQIRQLPRGSQIAIGENYVRRPVRFLNDLRTAETRLSKAETFRAQDLSFPLNETILSAIQLQDEDRARFLAEGGDELSDRFIREIYIYTDRFRSAWQMEGAERIQREVERCPWLKVYLIDVGVEPGTNLGFASLSVSNDHAVQGLLCRVTAEIFNQTSETLSAVVEMYLGDERSDPTKRDQKLIAVEPGETARVDMNFTPDHPGTFQGELRLIRSDPLSCDNFIPFTVSVHERQPVWIVAEDEGESYVWQQALAPDGLVEREGHQYEVSQLSPLELAHALQDVSEQNRPSVIYLLNVSRLTPQGWDALKRYVESGGGVGILLGSTRIDTANFREQTWLPAEVQVHSRASGPMHVEISQPEHPVFSYLNEMDALGMFASATVHRYWKVDPAEGAQVLATFSPETQVPALVAGRWGRGHVAMMSTAVDLEGASERRNWSELARLGWIYAAWGDHLTRFLSGLQDRSVNRVIGMPMLIDLPAETPPQKALLRQPGLVQFPLQVPFRHPQLIVSIPDREAMENSRSNKQYDEDFLLDKVGNYRLILAESKLIPPGFSFQLPLLETDMTRLSETELDELFGAGRWQLSRTLAELERSVLMGRIGIEAYPLLIAILLALFLLEHLVANVFYGRNAAERRGAA
ncbi:MAG: BatA domain-containing protein [Planctomycetaceae bacterium]|nr:BatA domain-containing protein [Planctomycetaceae bacterium]